MTDTTVVIILLALGFLVGHAIAMLLTEWRGR